MEKEENIKSLRDFIEDITRRFGKIKQTESKNDVGGRLPEKV